jgi:hypothetical protein
MSESRSIAWLIWCRSVFISAQQAMGRATRFYGDRIKLSSTGRDLEEIEIRRYHPNLISPAAVVRFYDALAVQWESR